MIIGITGGVGAGKSKVLSYFNNEYSANIIEADRLANNLLYDDINIKNKIISLLGADILDSSGDILKSKVASKIFEYKGYIQEINKIVHPKVMSIIKNKISETSKKDILIIEAALLIEGGYLPLLDKLIYVYADKETRIKRLKDNRNYSDEKCLAIMSNQLSDEEFRRHSHFIIDNSGAFEITKKTIDDIMKKLGFIKKSFI